MFFFWPLESCIRANIHHRATRNKCNKRENSDTSNAINMKTPAKNLPARRERNIQFQCATYEQRSYTEIEQMKTRER